MLFRSKSAIKRIRSNNAKRLDNRYYAKSTRTAIKTVKKSEDAQEQKTMLPKVSSMIDKLAKKGVIHKNKARNLKSKLAKRIQRSK